MRMTTASPPSLIAIDGPAASGKTTLGRRLAERLGYRFLDTGLMYRAFTLAALRRGIGATSDESDALAHEIDMHLEGEPEARVFLGPEDVTGLLHTDEIERHVSAYSRLPAVREAMRTRQREYASRGHVILAGRDIGEVVLPDAGLKFYLEASEEMREARRRGERVSAENALGHALRQRDERDAPRTFRAGDAVVIDTTHLSLEEVIARAWEAIQCFSA
jgi:cytidylate kinase